MAASHHAVWTLHWRWSQGQIQPTYDFLLCSCQKGYLRISDDQACSTDPEWLPPTTLCGHYTEGEVKVKYNPHMIYFFVAVKRVIFVSLMTRPAVLTRNGCLPSTTLCGHYTEGEVKVKYNPLMISFFVAVKRVTSVSLMTRPAVLTRNGCLPSTTLCGHYTEGEVKVKYNPHMIYFFVAVKRVTSVFLMTRPAVLTRNGCLPPRCVDITLRVKSRSNTTHLVFPSLWLSKGLPPYLWWPGLQYWPGMTASHHTVWTLHWGWSQGQIQPTYDFLLCSCQKGYLRISDDQACSTDPEWLPSFHHAVWTLHWRWSQGQIQPTYDLLLCSCQKGYLRISDDQACSTDPEWLPPTTLCGHYTEGEVKVKYNPPLISFFVAVKRVTSVSLMTRPAVLTRNGCLPPRCVDITLKVKSRSNTTHLWFLSLWLLKGYLRISDDQACSTDPEWLPPTTLCGHYTEGEVKVKYNPLSISFFVAVKRVTSVFLMTRPAVLTRNGCLPPHCVDITLKVKSRSNTTHLVFPSL